jgi:hypothetical protein
MNSDYFGRHICDLSFRTQEIYLPKELKLKGGPEVVQSAIAVVAQILSGCLACGTSILRGT